MSSFIDKTLQTVRIIRFTIGFNQEPYIVCKVLTAVRHILIITPIRRVNDYCFNGLTGTRNTE